MAKFSACRRFICSRETKGKDKGQRQKIEEEGERRRGRQQWKGEKGGKGERRVICPGGRENK